MKGKLKEDLSLCARADKQVSGPEDVYSGYSTDHQLFPSSLGRVWLLCKLAANLRNQADG